MTDICKRTKMEIPKNATEPLTRIEIRVHFEQSHTNNVSTN